VYAISDDDGVREAEHDWRYLRPLAVNPRRKLVKAADLKDPGKAESRGTMAVDMNSTHRVLTFVLLLIHILKYFFFNLSSRADPCLKYN
jgi:hypothetical protein